MDQLTSKIHEIMDNHFTAYKVTVDTNDYSSSFYKLRVSPKLAVTEIIIYPNVIIEGIKDNFTIFERLYHGKKLHEAAIMVTVSTIYNVINSRECLRRLGLLIGDKIATESEYARREPDLINMISMLYNEIIPYTDRNKYIIQPNITVNLDSRLPVIFSNMELFSYMDMIGYRPEKNQRGKVLPWQ